jgi:hypothetical protein
MISGEKRRADRRFDPRRTSTPHHSSIASWISSHRFNWTEHLSSPGIGLDWTNRRTIKMKKLVIGAALGVLLTTTSAFAQTSGNGEAPANSGPGVQGPPDTRTGPATKGVGPSGTSQPWDHRSDSSSGSSAGAEGSTENMTSPNQDSRGVKGAPGSTAGPAEVSPKSAGESAKHAP